MNGEGGAFIFVRSGVWAGRGGARCAFGGQGRADRGLEMLYLNWRDFEEFICFLYFMACAQGIVKSRLFRYPLVFF